MDREAGVPPQDGASTVRLLPHQGTTPLDPALAKMQERVHLLQQMRVYRDRHRREFAPSWYPWQLEGFSAPESQLMTLAGNQTGKTMSAGFHFALDATSDYPPWWNGFKFAHAPNMLALGVDNDQLKTVVQRELFGDVDDKKRFQGGWIHADEIAGVEWSGQLKNLARRVYVKHPAGNTRITLRAYTQSKTGQASLSFSGTTLDLIWVDECPPDDLIGQLTVRTIHGNLGRGGRMRYTMTPELGMTSLVTNFMETQRKGQRLIGPISWDECPHLTPEVQESVLAGIPEHERDMRRRGVPYFGSGLVYPVAESRIRCDPFPIANHSYMRFIRAIDLGISHPTAIVWLVYDPETDVIFLVKTYSVKGENAATHAAAANTMWPWAPIVFPHDIDTTEKGSGKTVRHFYQDAGLRNSIDFKNADGSIKVEPGIFDLYERMRDGRFFVFANGCDEFWREFRTYHRKDGKLVKEHDDVMDALRYGSVMVTRYGAHPGGHRKPRVVKSHW